MEPKLEIIYEDLLQFELSEDISLFYNPESKEYWVEHDDEEIEDIILIESPSEDVHYESNMKIWDITLFEVEWEAIKLVVSNDSMQSKL